MARARAEFFTKDILNGVNSRIERAMRQTVILVENRVKLLQTGPKSGRWYRIGKSPTKQVRAIGRRGRSLGGRWYRASAPGEPPAIRTSRLYKSVTSSVQAKPGPRGGLGWLGEVGTNVKDYPKSLEEGVKAGGRRRGAGPAMHTVAVQHIGGGQMFHTIRPVAVVTFAGGWRVAPRPLWGRAVKDLAAAIKALWAGAAARGVQNMPRGGL